MAHFTAQIKSNRAGGSTEVVQCRTFEDIPFKRWADRRGQLVLQFPTYGYEANFIVNKTQVRHMGLSTKGLDFTAESVQQLLLEIADRTEELAIALGFTDDEVLRQKEETEERNLAIVKDFGIKEDSGGWGGPLAMLAGAGILAITKAAKTKQVQEVEQVEEVVEEVQE